MPTNQTPSTFSAFFERLVATTPLENQSQLADILQVGRAAISLAKQKDTTPSKWIFRLAEMYSLSSDWLATGKGSPYAHTVDSNQECMAVPHVLPQLSPDGSLQFDPQFQSPLRFHHDWLSRQGNPNEIISLTMTGPCMHPEIQDGDLLLINRNDTALISGGIFAVSVEELILVRRVERSPGHLLMLCDNPVHPDMTFADADRNRTSILGKVFWTGRVYRW